MRHASHIFSYPLPAIGVRREKHERVSRCYSSASWPAMLKICTSPRVSSSESPTLLAAESAIPWSRLWESLLLSLFFCICPSALVGFRMWSYARHSF
ncbi:hypothetical protein BDV24DRAFT_33707 [Aspergillus arachidicola]|uniref:Uncharacterized protein n=1 Tax=Aspergillus arachidicola TaxID=656916 RepID=A0A5N6YCI8_9EURO|nr:hypothetical protein BDV24DRAFT_33707 [Aspergillus arachidicola]